MINYLIKGNNRITHDFSQVRSPRKLIWQMGSKTDETEVEWTQQKKRHASLRNQGSVTSSSPGIEGLYFSM